MGRAFEYRKAAKLKRWGTMSKLFPKLGKMITIAVKEGGGADPNMNSRLRTAILNAKAQNMPKQNIESAIKRALGKNAVDIKQIKYEAKAPHGVQLIIECATDNPTRTVANVKAILTRGRAEMLTSGSLNYMFTQKSIFIFDKSDNIDLEELELELIDFGLEEIEIHKEPTESGEDRDIVKIFGEFKSFGELSKALEDRGVEVKKAEVQWIANSPITLTEEQMADIEPLLDKLEEDDDVQAVYTNID